MWLRPEKRLWWKYVKSKGGTYAEMLLVTLKKFDNNDPGHKTLRQENVWSSLLKLSMWSTAFLYRPWLLPFDFWLHIFFITAFIQVLAATFFTARVYLVEITIMWTIALCTYICMYQHDNMKYFTENSSVIT